MELYRFESYPGQQAISLEKYDVIKETPAGYWIADWQVRKGKRWVAKTGFKRFAYVSKEEAADSFIARKNRYLRIQQARLESTKESLEFFEKNRDELVNEPPVKLISYQHECVDDGGFLLGACKICGKLLEYA